MPEDRQGGVDQGGVDSDAETLDSLTPGTSETRISGPSAPPIPDKIGGYAIRRVIASGGMGTVYEAVQEHPRRTVAVKVMKHGISSRSALRRFEYESQILARLRHPGIAQVYEAGMHDDGTGGVPFFAMEYVAGARPIIEYGTSKGLEIPGQLDLFVKVCEAVHHGHQKGIIHRDLKPDNILVDSSGQPKIIDFGVARATDSDLAVTTLQTEVGQLVGTVQYMSPEQIEADPHDIDTRSDVYGLGVVLYELLTGRLPYDLASLPVFEATRIIHEEQPTRISSINHSLRGDVETIVLHALEKDRDRRYQSALELAQDIRRFRNDRPILARPPSLAYLCKTFAKRNKALVGGAAAVLIALVFGVIGTSTGWARARAALEVARTEAGTYNAMTDYFHEMFTSLDAREGAGPEARVADLLDDAAADIDVELDGQPVVQARLHGSIGNGYRALTLFDKAEGELRAAVAIQRQELGQPHEDLAQSLEDLAAVLWYRGDFAEAEPMFGQSLDMRREMYGEEHEKVASSLNYLAACVDTQGRHEEAEELYRRALEMRRRLLGDDDEMVARSMNNLATCYMKQHEWEEAERLFREATAIVRAVRGPRHIDVAGGLSNRGRCLVKMGDDDAAEILFREALSIKRSALRADHASIAITQHHLAKLLNQAGQHEEAETLCREALAIRRLKYEPTDSWVINSTTLLADILTNTGDLTAEEQARRELLELRRLAAPDGDWRVAQAEGQLGACLTRRERYAEAEPLLVGSHRRLVIDLAPDNPEIVAALERLAELYEAWGRPNEARAYREKIAQRSSDP